MPTLRDLHLEELAHIEFPQEFAMPGSVCEKAAQTYHLNCNMATSLFLIPGITAVIGEHLEASLNYAEEELAKAEHANKTEEEKGEFARNYVRDLFPQRYERKYLKFWESLEETTQLIDFAIPHVDPYSHLILENLLKAIVVQSWTAVEALVNQIWGNLRDSGNSRFLDYTTPEFHSKKLGLKSRDRIRNTYRHSFRDDATILNALDKSKIDPLAVTRNCIVHAGGKVDDDFKKDAAPFDIIKNFTSLPLGKPIEFDGKLVRSLIEPAIKSGYDLLVAVDLWIKKNP